MSVLCSETKWVVTTKYSEQNHNYSYELGWSHAAKMLMDNPELAGRISTQSLPEEKKHDAFIL
jgi:hypothetical protein